MTKFCSHVEKNIYKLFLIFYFYHISKNISEYQCLHKMPSILLQEASRNDQEPSVLSVWPSSSDYNIEKQVSSDV